MAVIQGMCRQCNSWHRPDSALGCRSRREQRQMLAALSLLMFLGALLGCFYLGYMAFNLVMEGCRG